MPATPAPTAAPAAAAPSTRERILDIALELFTERGYDKTSIRDIADRLGTTGAALYYHFRSKADILLELYLRLHGVGQRSLAEFEELPDGAARTRAWSRLVDDYITAIDEQRDLMQLYLRNRNTIETLQAERGMALDHDVESSLRRLAVVSGLSAEVRVRMACTIGAVKEVLLSDGLVGDIPRDELVALARAAVADLFRPDGR